MVIIFSPQGCLQFVSDVVVDNLYNIGAIGMAFGTFEVHTLFRVLSPPKKTISWGKNYIKAVLATKHAVVKANLDLESECSLARWAWTG